ncbi:dihydroorotate dehydrogenase (fumarate) [Aphanomyces astaci]|uniref:Dihydroorotate dehydrogenase (quinone), mitochondrial n=1 Tax=Aphanomyces astaci TaxID=112090 RepID=W4FYL0_APHAT|nr:dihydroorotate dehydrogenase (fumarate) [Aphanomyces astaci]ETV71768.1 dihydroorotate dehydrogenase (fumarate) [Aphanomyces astaci]|eukprot:XP_009838617.1 dihydroorotate dehydrogenase (fumarate) [Aphanomyces astaci]
MHRVLNVVARPAARSALAMHGTSRRCMSSIPTGSSSPVGPILLGATALGLYTFRQSFLTTFMDPVLMPLLRLLGPETSHVLAVQAAKYGWSVKDTVPDDPSLHVSLLGLSFDNPIGIAAGFDKHADAMQGLLDMGFGFVEIGSVTPLPQDGNPKPRVFRLVEDRGVINRYGFNSQGHAKVRERLEKYKYWTLSTTTSKQYRRGPLGVNLGKNKSSDSPIEDYVRGVETLGPFGDYLVINISSPNTPGLRSLQGKKELHALVSAVLDARNKLWKRLPLLVKIAPDLTSDDMRDIAEVALALQIDGLIVSNTTISRPESLLSPHAAETGGLSGAPVKELSTTVLHSMYKLTEGKIPLIGVGGVATGQDAYDKIRAGASLVQLYSSLVFNGPLAVARIKHELTACIKQDGYTSVAEAVGAAHNDPSSKNPQP